MKKSALLSYVLWGYKENMESTEFEGLKNRILDHLKEVKYENTSDLADGIHKNYPEFEILHQAYHRSKMDKISKGINTIKTILIVYFIASIIGALTFILSFPK